MSFGATGGAEVLAPTVFEPTLPTVPKPPVEHRLRVDRARVDALLAKFPKPPLARWPSVIVIGQLVKESATHFADHSMEVAETIQPVMKKLGGMSADEAREACRSVSFYAVLDQSQVDGLQQAIGLAADSLAGMPQSHVEFLLDVAERLTPFNDLAVLLSPEPLFELASQFESAGLQELATAYLEYAREFMPPYLLSTFAPTKPACPLSSVAGVRIQADRLERITSALGCGRARVEKRVDFGSIMQEFKKSWDNLLGSGAQLFGEVMPALTDMQNLSVLPGRVRELVAETQYFYAPTPMQVKGIERAIVVSDVLDTRQARVDYLLDIAEKMPPVHPNALVASRSPFLKLADELALNGLPAMADLYRQWARGCVFPWDGVM